MAKFYISNSKELMDLVSNTNDIFSISGILSSESTNGVVFNKHIKALKNIYLTENGGVFIVGTPICQDIKNEDLGKYIYDTFSMQNIDYYKNHIMGMWAIFIVKDNTSYCFNDYYGLYDIFYTVNDTNYSIGNSLADILLGRENFEFNEYPFIMENFISEAFPGETQFKDIFCLKGNQFIKIDNKKISINNIDMKPLKYKFNSEQESIKEISEQIIKYSSLVKNNYGKVAMFMTGGLDSRLLFAGFHNSGCSMECVHGISNGSCPEDKKIVKDITSFYQKNLTFLDWKYEVKYSSQNQSDVFNEIGFFNWIDAGNKKYFDELKRVAENCDFLQVGYFCEALRLREWGENKGKSHFSLKEYVEEYCMNDDIRNSYTNYANFESYLMANYRNILRSIGYEGDEEKIPMDFLEPLRWVVARKYDSRFTMMVNMYMPSFLIMSVPTIHERVLSLPASIIKGGRFQIKLIESLDKELISEFKVFSHRRSFKIRNYKKVKALSLRSIADDIIKIAPWTKRLLHKIYAITKKTENADHHRVKEIKKHIQDFLPNYIDYEKYRGSYIRLTALAISLREIAIKKSRRM